MRTRDNKTQSEEHEEEKRDLELENIVGNLLLAEYQVERLRTRLADMVDGFRPEIIPSSSKSSSSSALSLPEDILTSDISWILIP